MGITGISVTRQKITLIMQTQRVLGFHFFVSFFLIVVNFLHVCGENYSIVAARNAWGGNLVCLCVMEHRSCTERWMVEGEITLKKGLRN
jgi:hypothetical protein